MIYIRNFITIRNRIRSILYTHCFQGDNKIKYDEKS